MREIIKNPYVGPRSYEEGEADFFFGRDRESEALLSLVISEPLVLFYAQSGAGKSSLINARLRPSLEEEEFLVLPTGRVSGTLPGWVDSVPNIYLFNLLMRLDGDQTLDGDLSQLSLVAFLRDYRSRPGNKDRALVLIIDQFEEILTTNRDHWPERADFFRQLGKALDGDDLLWIILAIREDFVAGLDPYAHFLPDRLRARFHLQRLGYDAAMDAVTQPAAKLDVSFPDDAAGFLVDHLCRTEIPGQDDTYQAEFVEAVQLQVVCQRLWQDTVLARGATEITRDDIPAGYIQDALIKFYDEVIDDMATADYSGARLRSWIEGNLITELETRATIYQGETETAGLPNSLIEGMIRRFLLKDDMRAGGVWYELIHDRMVQPVLESNRAYFLEATPPEIEIFDLQPEVLQLGEEATLTWQVNRAERVVLEPAGKQLKPSGTLKVAPDNNVTYWLVAERPGVEFSLSEMKRLLVVDRRRPADVTPGAMPYVGPRPFARDETYRFYGRETEAEKLLLLVVDEPVVYFFGQAGAGRSSLLNARLVPDLRLQGFDVLMVRLRVGEQSHDHPADNIYVHSLLARLDEQSDAEQDLTQVTIREYLAQRLAPVNQSGAEAPTKVLIIDQGEEVFIQHPELWSKREPFFGQLADAVADETLNLKIVLCLREEFAVMMNAFTSHFSPAVPQQYYLRRLEKEQALVAITRPAASAGVEFAPGAAEALVDNLSQVRVQKQDGQIYSYPGQYIEPVQLQVVCSQLWRNIDPAPGTTIKLDDIQRLGDVDDALVLFYEQTVQAVGQRLDASEAIIRYWIEDKLITSEGTRGTVYMGQNETAGMSNAVVRALSDRFLLRAEQRAGAMWFELVHDRFIQPILDANRAWRASTPPIDQAEQWALSGRPDNKLIRYDGSLKMAFRQVDALGGVDPLTEQFLAASQQYIELEKEQNKGIRNFIFGANGCLILMVVLIFLAGMGAMYGLMKLLG